MRTNKSTVEDLMESFIAAVKILEGYEFAQRFIRILVDRYVDLTRMVIDDDNAREQIILGRKDTSFSTVVEALPSGVMAFKATIIQKGKEIVTGPAMNTRKAAEKAAARLLVK